MITLSTIYYYPAKSMRGIQTTGAEVAERGLLHDRRWMLVDREGTFITQRQHPSLARVSLHPAPGGWQIQAPAMPLLSIRVPDEDAQTGTVTIWRDEVAVQHAGDEAADWFNRYTGVPGVQLVYMPDMTRRRVDGHYADKGEIVSFADGFPFLLISTASLADLNNRMQTPLPMSRFRPNLVVDGCTAFDEDGWKRIRVGGLTFRLVKPCSRCKVTTVDQLTAETGKEPLKTLASYRRWDNEVWFGMNLVHEQTGELHTGSEVEVLE